MPATTTTAPARTPTVKTALAPYWCTTGTNTTVMAPVGPETCTLEPPNTAATSPATIAVISPAVAPSPLVIPNASANGNATTPTLMPASTSCRHERGSPS